MMKRFFGSLFALLVFLSPALAGGCVGGFQPIVGSVVPATNGEFRQVHFYAENGNQQMINGVNYTIPAGVPVVSGGVPATYNDAYINKVPHQSLIPNQTYFVYTFMASPTDMELSFSGNGHTPDPATGMEVMNAAGIIDATQTLVGMVHTDGSGMFLGNAANQLTIGWCPAGRAAVTLVAGLGYPMGADYGAGWVPVGPTVSWLQWGVDSAFGEGFDNPDVEIIGNVGNTNGGGVACEVNVRLDGNPAIQGLAASATVTAGTQAIFLHSISPSAAGTNEGYHFAQAIIKSDNAGNCHFGSAYLIARPVQS